MVTKVFVCFVEREREDTRNGLFRRHFMSNMKRMWEKITRDLCHNILFCSSPPAKKKKQSRMMDYKEKIPILKFFSVFWKIQIYGCYFATITRRINFSYHDEKLKTWRTIKNLLLSSFSLQYIHFVLVYKIFSSSSNVNNSWSTIFTAHAKKHFEEISRCDKNFIAKKFVRLAIANV